MTTRVPLILSRDPMSRGGSVPVPTPDLAVVYVTLDNQVHVVDGTWKDRRTTRMIARYRWRYTVDTGDHVRTVQFRSEPLPARGGIASFDSSMDVGFRVVDPAAIVRRDIDDGLAVVYSNILAICRPITRTFDISQAGDAENAVNARFRAGERLDEGIHLFMLRARLSAPDHVKRAQDVDAVRHRGDVRDAEHAIAAADARREVEIDWIRHQGDIARRLAEREQQGRGELTPSELIRAHLAHSPHDTATAMTLLAQVERARLENVESLRQREFDLFRFMADRNLIHAVDVDRFRDRALGEAPGPGGAPRSGPRELHAAQALPTAADLWSAPLPQPEPPAPVSPAEPPGPPGAASHVVPVYLVLDRSSAMSGYGGQLDAGVRTVVDALEGFPDVAATVRLTLVEYATDAVVHVGDPRSGDPVDEQGATLGGHARYAVAFERLLDCIPRDVESLKRSFAQVRRPQVVFLTGGAPADETSWQDVYGRLVDRERMRYAPDVMAFGVGAAAPATVRRVATARELAFVAVEPGADRAAEQFFAFLARQLVEYGRAVARGEVGPVVMVPPGFRPAGELE